MNFVLNLNKEEISDLSLTNDIQKKKKIIHKSSLDFSRSLKNLDSAPRILATSIFFLNSLITALLSVSNNEKFEKNQNNLTDRSTSSASDSLLGSTGPAMDIFIDFFPFLNFILEKKKNPEKNNSFKSLALVLTAIPVTLVFFEKIAKLKILTEESKYQVLFQACVSFFRSLALSSLFITFGIIANHLFKKHIESRILDKMEAPADGSDKKISHVKKILLRICVSLTLIAIIKFSIPKIQNLTMNFLTSMNAGADLVSLVNNFFSGILICFGVYCLTARLIVPVARDIIKENNDLKNFGTFRATMLFFFISFTLFIIKNYIEKYLGENFSMKKIMTDSILAFAIITAILFGDLIVKSKQNELKEKIEKITDIDKDSIKNELHASSKKSFIIASSITTLMFSIVISNFILEIESGIMKNVISIAQNPLIFTIFILASFVTLISAILEKGLANSIEFCEQTKVTNFLDNSQNFNNKTSISITFDSATDSLVEHPVIAY